ncbi:hypothetical protein GFS24_10335 [Chitinophaga sp. SYP-B3965]|uniref:hypothetical protein n=1 Tax=Chitinophaga sp. SYP-B3965 TaxID=2663120 RepID=UPI0012996A2F|nr:hypothetical protein [Chitinophaga sp. SYP-B3965]MRG45514.1 hypothetical protein [Chitinophaga sp. SYP-B3965]
MKVLGVVQFKQKRFKLLGIAAPWLKALGNLPAAFMGIIYGKPGNGKTEYCMQLAAYLTNFGKVAWLSYEQGHGFDLQLAVNRNIDERHTGKFLVIDPEEDIPPGVSLFEDLDNFLSKRNSPDFVFIDSLDYTRFTWAEYLALKKKHGKKKGIIFISHAKGKGPKTNIGEQIEHDGAFGIFVSKFIAYIHKNRYGGTDDYIIYEERARQLNPLYFEQKAMSNAPKEKAPAGRKKKKVDPEQLEPEKKEVIE